MGKIVRSKFFNEKIIRSDVSTLVCDYFQWLTCDLARVFDVLIPSEEDTIVNEEWRMFITREAFLLPIKISFRFLSLAAATRRSRLGSSSELAESRNIT